MPSGLGWMYLVLALQTTWRWPLVPVMSRLYDCHFHVFVCMAATDILVWWHFDRVFCFCFFLLKSKRTNYGGASI